MSFFINNDIEEAMKNITLVLILSVLFSTLGCQQSLMMKKEDEHISYLSQEKGLLHRAAREAEQAQYSFLYDDYTFTNNALYYNALRIDPYPWQNFKRIDVSISNIYTVQTPVIDSFLTGTLFAASTALILHQTYKGNSIRIPPNFK
jgi:hypothetical protein